MGLNRNLGNITEVLTVSGSNIGINNTSPSYKLDVNGSVNINNDLYVNGKFPYTIEAEGGVNIDDAFGLYWKTAVDTPGGTLVGIGQSSSGLNFYTNSSLSSPKVVFLANGNVGIGTANPLSGLVVQKNTSGGRGGEISIVNFATQTAGNNAALNFGLEPSTYDNDNCNFQLRATLTGLSGASTDGVFSNWNGANFVETLRIRSTGTLSVPYGQIQFPASQNSSSDPNTLDDYEEGTWSPQLSGTGGGAAGMSGITAGRYTKIGNKVTATAQIQWGSIITSISGNVVVSGLPFTSQTPGVRCCGSMGAVQSGLTFPSGFGEWVYLIDPGFSSVYIIANSTTGAGYTHVPNIASSGIVYSLTITYFTA